MSTGSRSGRALQYALVLVAAITLNFLLPRLMPGNPLALLAGVDVGLMTPAERAQVLKRVGLDRPLYVQYLDYWGDLLRGDLGYSYRQKRPIHEMLLATLPWLAWWSVQRTHELPREPGPADDRKRSSWDLLRNADFRRLMALNWLLSSCWDVHTFLVPVLGHERGLSATAIGAILGGFALAATAIRLLMPWIAARLRESAVIASAMFATAVLFGLYPFAHAAWTMAALSVLLGFALGSVQPMILSALHQMTPDGRYGEVIAMRSMVMNASSTAMPLLFGAAGTALGAAALFWLMGAVVASGSWLARRLPVQR